MSHDEMIAAIQGHKEGKIIECRYIKGGDDEWSVVDGPVWNFSEFNYRVRLREESSE